MASIKALLKINENGNGVIESVTTNVETRNISTLPYTTDVTSWFLNQTSENKNYQGATFNVLGVSTYGNSNYGVRQTNNTYTNQYIGLVYGCPSQLQSNFTITIVGTDVLAFKIYFDTLEGQTPTAYTVYSSISGQTTTYSGVTNGIIEVSNLLAGHGTTIITVTSWQEQNKPIAIKYFENVEINVQMDKYWIDSFETQTQKTSDGELIQYGVLASTGNIVLKDKNKKLLNYSKMGYLNMYLFTLDLYINEMTFKRYPTHISNSAPYFIDNYTMKFELTDIVEKFKNKYISQSWGSGYSAYEIFNELCGLYDTSLQWLGGYFLEWTSNGNVQSFISDYLSNFQVPSGQTLAVEGNFLDILNDFCGAFGLQMYIENGKYLQVSMARPRMTVSEFNGGYFASVIPYNKQYSDFDYSILTINRYDRVFFDDEITSTSYKNAVTLKKNVFFNLENINNQSDTVEKILRESILEDYADGIKIAKLSVFPSDLYSVMGNSRGKWKYGVTIFVNDILKIENKDGNNVLYDKNYNDVYWRVIDRKVKYEGQVLIDLVLQEIKND